MSYGEIGPSWRLRDVAAAIWASPPRHREHRVLPDGCMDIVVHGGRAHVVGAMRTAIVVPSSTHAAVGVRLRPGELSRLLGVAASELTDGEAQLSELWGDDGRRLDDALAGVLEGAVCRGLSSVAIAERARPVIEAALERRIASTVREVDPSTRAAATWLGEGVAVCEVARRIGLSQRQLHRRFAERVGLGPRVFARVRRLQRAASLMQAGARPVDAALLAGYADQPHLTREANDLAGVSAGVLAHELTDGLHTSVPAPL